MTAAKLVGAAMTKEETTQFYDRWQQLWAAMDADGLADLHAPNGKVTSPMFGHITGRQAVAESYRRLFTAFPDWKVTVNQLIGDGDRVAGVLSASATHRGEFMGLPGTGRKAQIHGVLVHHILDGLIQEENRFYDFTLMLIQFGVLRAKPGH